MEAVVEKDDITDAVGSLISSARPALALEAASCIGTNTTWAGVSSIEPMRQHVDSAMATSSRIFPSNVGSDPGRRGTGRPERRVVMASDARR